MIVIHPLSRMLALAGALVASQAVAQDDPDRDTPIARAPDLTLGDLLPSDLPQTAFVSVSMWANDAEGPFEASFEALLDGGLLLTVFVSDREGPKGMVARLFEPGPMRDAVVDDEDFATPEGITCLGATAQVSITCTIGDGILQVTGSSIGDDAFPYENLEGHMAAIDLDAVAVVLAP